MKNKKNKKITSITVETWLIICWKFNGKSQQIEKCSPKTFEKQNKEFYLMENRNNYFGID